MWLLERIFMMPASLKALVAFLVPKTRRKSMFGTAPWLKGFKRDEKERVF